jgi:hypothetical protein
VVVMMCGGAKSNALRTCTDTVLDADIAALECGSQEYVTRTPSSIGRDDDRWWCRDDDEDGDKEEVVVPNEEEA